MLLTTSNKLKDESVVGDLQALLVRLIPFNIRGSGKCQLTLVGISTEQSDCNTPLSIWKRGFSSLGSPWTVTYSLMAFIMTGQKEISHQSCIFATRDPQTSVSTGSSALIASLKLRHNIRFGSATILGQRRGQQLDVCSVDEIDCSLFRQSYCIDSSLPQGLAQGQKMAD